MSLTPKLAAVVVLVALAGCETPRVETTVGRRPRATPTSSDTFVIGLVGTLSGPESWRGEDAFEGADLAVQVLNRLRSEDAPRFELVTLDDRGDPSVATRLVEELATSDRTMGVVYAGPPLGLPSAGQALAVAGVPALLCHGDLFSAGLLRGNMFQMSPPYLWQAQELIDYAVRDRGYRRIGLLASEGQDGSAAVRSLRAARPRPDAIKVVRYPVDVTAFDEQLAALRRARVSAIVVDAGPPTLALLFEELRANGYAYTTSREARRRAQTPGGSWAPQVLAFDPAIAARPPGGDVHVGTVASDAYARGAATLAVPSFLRFRSSFREWWAHEPIGWQQRAYDAVRLIGWAAERSTEGRAGVAAALEEVRAQRFGGTDITFSADDHLAVDPQTVGLWTVPRPGAPGRTLLEPGLPWVPLARGFFAGARTRIPPEDRSYLFRGPPRRSPTIASFRFGVTSGRSDPVH